MKKIYSDGFRIGCEDPAGESKLKLLQSVRGSR